jgi:CRP-like cAMP-binding protein
VKKRRKVSFEPRKFLAVVGDGKSISKYLKDQVVFSQGDEADAVFFIQKGKVKLTVVSDRGKEAVVGILGVDHFFGEGCLNGHPLMEWSGRAPAPPAIEAGKGRQRQGARHVSNTQNRDRRSRHRYW